MASNNSNVYLTQLTSLLQNSTLLLHQLPTNNVIDWSSIIITTAANEHEVKSGKASDVNAVSAVQVDDDDDSEEESSDDDENMMVGFHPPSLGSLRSDIMEKVGELEGQTIEDRERASEGYVWDEEESESVSPMKEKMTEEEKKKQIDELERSIIEDPRNALDF